MKAYIRFDDGCEVEMDCVHFQRRMSVSPFGKVEEVIDLSGMRSRNSENWGMVVKSLKAKRVIYNYPATIVLWEDGTKTVVKCQDGETYQKETGLALCYMKKALGNISRNLNDALKAGEGELCKIGS